MIEKGKVGDTLEWIFQIVFIIQKHIKAFVGNKNKQKSPIVRFFVPLSLLVRRRQRRDCGGGQGKGSSVSAGGENFRRSQFAAPAAQPGGQHGHSAT